jgi:drug/metabolite transporter (DMT)-like permease
VSRKLQPAPPPLEANDRLVTVVITAAWAIALIIVLVVRDSLPPGQRWWVWVCAVGLGMGLFGLWYVPRLKRSRARVAERRAATADGPDRTP